MRISFFGPCLRSSAIGRASALVVRALREQGNDVYVIRSEDVSLVDNPVHDFGMNVFHWSASDVVQSVLADADLVVYQIGDNFSFHRGCVAWLERVPGLVCLHDNFLGHLFWAHADTIGRDTAQSLLRRFYGVEIAGRFFDHSSSETFLKYAAEAAPMTEWIAEMANGVIVHSRWGVDRIIRVARGPVEVVSLPYDAPFLAGHGGASLVSRAAGQRRTVLTIGHVNPNKRHASVIEALGSSKLLQDNLKFRAVGPVEPAMADYLRDLAKRHGVEFELTGEVDDGKLAEFIIGADLMCCLRWPALEAASASTIEAMLYGKPVIVTDTGFYRDLPRDCVIKISHEGEVQGLRAALEEFVSRPNAVSEMGIRAQQYAAQTFRADRYAERLVAMKADMDRAQLLAGLADDVVATIRRWGGADEPTILDPIMAPLSIFR